jgi:Rrf2 family protein
MKLINREADYALKALLTIARLGAEVTPVSLLTAELRLPRPYLRKIMQILARKGLVQSFTGRGGGYALGRPPARITVADVLRAFQGEISLHDCLFKKRVCQDISTCPLRTAIGRLEQRLIKDFEDLSVASILAEPKGRPKRPNKGG